MNFQLLQTAIQNGWSTSETNIDDIKPDANMTKILVAAGTNFDSFEDEELFDWFDEMGYEDDITRSIAVLIESQITKDKMIKVISEYNGIEEAWYWIEGEKMSKINIEYSELDDNEIGMYLKYMTDSDEYYDTIQRQSDFEAFVKRRFEEDEPLDHSDIIAYIQNYKYDLDTAKSNPFIRSLNNINSEKNGLYRDTHFLKHEMVESIFNEFNYDPDLVSLYFDRLHYIDEEDFDSNLLRSQIEKDVKETKRNERRNNRISYDEANDYIRNNKFDADIQVSKGYIGLEDMTFDALYINGEQQGGTFMDRPWISGRDFGDNSMAKDWFFEKVNAYKVDEDEKEIDDIS